MHKKNPLNIPQLVDYLHWFNLKLNDLFQKNGGVEKCNRCPENNISRNVSPKMTLKLNCANVIFPNTVVHGAFYIL